MWKQSNKVKQKSSNLKKYTKRNIKLMEGINYQIGQTKAKISENALLDD